MATGQSATDRAYGFTKEHILDSRFPGGELLSEGDVAHALGVSRTPVREAFLRLEGEGLLRLYPKRGALVVPVSVQEVEAVMETRIVVERYAVEKIIRTGAEISDQLRAAIERQESLVEHGDTPGFVEADRAFHRIFVAAAGNPIITGLYDSLRDRQARMGLVALARDDARVRQILGEHRDLTQAIEARDDDRAQSSLTQHLRGTLVLLQNRQPLAL